MRTAQTTKTGPILRAGARGAAVLMAAAACSSRSSPSSGSSTAVKPAPAQDAAGAPGNSIPGAPGRQLTGVGAVKAVPVRGAADVRSIIYKGEMTVRVDNVDEKAGRASTVATAADGIVAGDTRRSDGKDASADLVLRVPSKSFYDTVAKLGRLGTELERNVHTDDVTEAVVDLDARVASQKASVDRTRALLGKADRIADIVTIEGELARREADLASLQAQKRTVDDQVTLSTITLRLIGANAAAPAKAAPSNFFTGLAAGWHAFFKAVNGLLIAVGAALPFLIAMGVPAAFVIWLLRRRRPRPMARPEPAPEA